MVVVGRRGLLRLAPALLAVLLLVGWRLLSRPGTVPSGAPAELFLLLDSARDRIAQGAPAEEHRIHQLVPRLLVLADALDSLCTASRVAWREHLENVSIRRITHRGDGSWVEEAFVDRSPGAALLWQLSEATDGWEGGEAPDGSAGLALLLSEPRSPRAKGLLGRVEHFRAGEHPVDMGARILYEARMGQRSRSRLKALGGLPGRKHLRSHKDSLGAALAGLALALTDDGLSEGLSLLTQTGRVLSRHTPLNEFQAVGRQDVAADQFFADFRLLSDVAHLIRRVVIEGVRDRPGGFHPDGEGLALAAWFVETNAGLAGWDGYLPDTLRSSRRLIAMACQNQDPAWAWLAATRLVRREEIRPEDVPDSLRAWRARAARSVAWGDQFCELMAYPDRLVCAGLESGPSDEAPEGLLSWARDWWYETLPGAGPLQARVGESARAFVLLGTLERTRPVVGSGTPWAAIRRELREDLLAGAAMGGGSVFHLFLVATDVTEAWTLDPRRRLWFGRLRHADLRDAQLLWPLGMSASMSRRGEPVALRLAESVPGLGCLEDVLSMTASTEPSGGSRLQ